MRFARAFAARYPPLAILKVLGGKRARPGGLCTTA
jgi:hypothetical protein